MNTTTDPTATTHPTPERDVVQPGRRAGLFDRAVIGLGLALVVAGRAHADSARIGREPRAGFGPHRGAEVLRPFV